MNRFFIPPTAIQDETVIFPPEVSAQIARVLRLTDADRVLVLDDLGSAFEVQLETVSVKETLGRVLRKLPAGNEPQIRLVLQVCLTQREKYEWILQKGTELGVAAFMPVLSSRTLVQKADEVSGKVERWQKILREAAEQSERGRIPRLLPAMQLKNALVSQGSGLNLVLNEEESHLSLKQVLEKHSRHTTIRLLVGPEGGFSGDEIALARGTGYTSVTLGPRILRMETAAIAATAITMSMLGEMEM